jgi:hypothetical protein
VNKVKIGGWGGEREVRWEDVFTQRKRVRESKELGKSRKTVRVKN